MSKSERMRQVAQRTKALKTLEKDFSAGKMSAGEFADKASAIEAEVRGGREPGEVGGAESWHDHYVVNSRVQGSSRVPRAAQ
jgi:hypothetical protein